MLMFILGMIVGGTVAFIVFAVLSVTKTSDTDVAENNKKTGDVSQIK